MAKANKKVQYLIAYTVALGTVAAGAFTTWPAAAMPKFQNNETDIAVSPNELAWMVAMTSPGFMLGSFAVRFVADGLGRKANILISSLPFAIGTVIVATARRAWLLYVTRLLWGFSSGILVTGLTPYLAEIADKEIRGSISIIGRYMFNFGNLLIMVVGPFVSYSTLNYLLLALPVIHFTGCLWIPESPYFLLKEGKVDAARKVLKKLRTYEDEKLLEDDLMEMKSHVRSEMRDSSTLKELLTGKKYRKAVNISIGLKLTQILNGQLIVSQYVGLIMYETGTEVKLTVIFIIFGFVRFVSSAMSSFLLDRVGRRPLLIWSYLGTGICSLIIATFFFCKEVIGYDVESLRPFSLIPFFGIIGSTIISSLGYYSVVTVIPGEIFPLNVKAIALTSLSMFGGFFNFIEARGYQGLKDVSGLCGVFSFLGVVGIIGSLFSFFYVPETKGKSLREIQELLQGNLFENYEDIRNLNADKCLDLDKVEAESKELLEVNKN